LILENRTFAELSVGDSATITRTVTFRDIQVFAIVSGDVNPAHVDEAYARRSQFKGVIAHGLWGGAVISSILGTRLPGPGTIYRGQSLRFRRPVYVGDTITLTVRVAEKQEEKHRVSLGCIGTNQNGEVVMTGVAEVIAPTEKIRCERVTLPEIELVDRSPDS
jgi:acyl dehydratase